MRAMLLIGTLVLTAACAEQPTVQTPAPAVGTPVYGAGSTPGQTDPCNRSDFPDGSAGDAAYTNCVIQS